MRWPRARGGKPRWLLLAALFASIPAAAQAPAQAPPPEVSDEPNPEALAEPGPAWTIQVDPLTTLLGYVHLQVERRLSSHWSLYAGPHFRLFTAPWDDAEDFQGYGVELGLRYFFTGSAPEGWWVCVRGVLARLRAGDVRAPGGYASVLGGYTGIVGDHFVLSGGLGVQYLHYRIEGLGPKQFFVAAHTALGVAF